MQTFSQFPYQRPDTAETIAQMEDIISRIAHADAFSLVQTAIDEMNTLTDRLHSMASLAQIRNTLDTTDAYYEAEQDYFDETLPIFSEFTTRYYQALLDSPFRAQIKDYLGEYFLRLADVRVRQFRPEIIADLQEDNRLSSEYQKLCASCQVEFLGEVRNLPGITKFLQDPDRSIRRQAYQAWTGFFTSIEDELDRLFDSLVKVRTRMAQKMGFEHFTELGYLLMERMDYGEAEVAAYRKQVEETVVPFCTQLYQRQKVRIGVEQLKYYDEMFVFQSGNAKPQGDRDFLVDAAQEMYNQLSPETGEFFRMMVDRQLLELEAKPGKAMGGYCDYLGLFSAPFIFSNFNGTPADVDVLTHEAGHAFMAHLSHQENTVPEYLFGSHETNEIHSMSMEFFTYPWMHLFFGEGADKYRFGHLSDALLFLPYGVCVDEFQHVIYNNPDLSPAQRKAAWRELERKYLPLRDYDGDPLMESGGFWLRQLHIFMHPFYYIDYTLASISAFEFYGKMQEDRDAAWADYVRLCKAGGSQSYLGLLALVGLKSPFDPGMVEAVLSPVRATLEAADDLALDRP